MSFFYLFLITPKHLFLQENISFHIRHEQIYADTLRTLCQHRHRRRLTKGTKGQTETKNEIFKSIPGRGRSSTLTIHFYKRKKWNSIWFTLVRDEILLRLSSTSGSPGRRREPIGDLIPRVNCDAAAGLRSAAEHEAAFRLGRTCRPVRTSWATHSHSAALLLATFRLYTVGYIKYSKEFSVDSSVWCPESLKVPGCRKLVVTGQKSYQGSMVK